MGSRAFPEMSTVPMLAICGILIFVLGVLSCIYATFLRRHPKKGNTISFSQGATEKDLGLGPFFRFHFCHRACA